MQEVDDLSTLPPDEFLELDQREVRLDAGRVAAAIMKMVPAEVSTEACALRKPLRFTQPGRPRPMPWWPSVDPTVHHARWEKDRVVGRLVQGMTLVGRG